MDKLVPLFAYQGGKTRVAKSIVDIILKESGENITFVDICCGGGSVSIEVVNRGIHPENIYMFDAGAIGAFWQQVSEGIFDIDYFEELIESISKDPRDIKHFMENLSTVEYDYVGEYISEYLVLQAASFGGKQIYDLGSRFSNTSFRAYWEPTKTSSRRSPVNPMMPMPETLRKRVQNLVHGMGAIKAAHTYAEYIDFSKIAGNKVVYIDPPYEGTTSYRDSLDLFSVIDNAKKSGATVYVSEYKPLSDDYHVISKTAKGGISGKRKGNMVEYLSKV